MIKNSFRTKDYTILVNFNILDVKWLKPEDYYVKICFCGFR